jgi:hypothetical protein
MRWLAFLSRLAFFCDVFFLLTLLVQWLRWSPNEQIEVTLIFVWYYMAVLLNPIAVVCFIILFFVNRAKLRVVPKWLMIANAVFLIFQVFYILHLNDH